MLKFNDSTDKSQAKYRLLKLALILEKQSLKTPFNILRIYTNIKWRFNQTADFDHQPNQLNEIRHSHHCQSTPNILKKSLKEVVQEIKIKNFTERIHNSEIEICRTSSSLKELVELARRNSLKRNLQKKHENFTKDVYQNIYEFGILFVFIAFIGSMYFVINKQIQSQ